MKSKGRKSSLTRKTRETEIDLSVDVDGSGRSSVSLSDEFLRHMVETLARYARFDIEIEASGDLDHHLIEDIAITLGAALREALGDAPVQRVSTAIVPMDEALVLVSIDLIDRPFVSVEVPNLLFEHFLRSFAMELRATLHSQVIRGQDEHHIIEATFKALGLCLGEATVSADKALSTKSNVEWKRNE